MQGFGKMEDDVIHDGVVKTQISRLPVIPAQAGDKRRLRSSHFNTFWIPACAGMTTQGTFYEAVIHYNSQNFSILSKYVNNAELDASEC